MTPSTPSPHSSDQPRRSGDRMRSCPPLVATSTSQNLDRRGVRRRSGTAPATDVHASRRAVDAGGGAGWSRPLQQGADGAHGHHPRPAGRSRGRIPGLEHTSLVVTAAGGPPGRVRSRRPGARPDRRRTGRPRGGECARAGGTVRCAHRARRRRTGMRTPGPGMASTRSLWTAPRRKARIRTTPGVSGDSTSGCIG